MGTILVTMAFIFVLLVGGIAVDRLYRAFAVRNAQLGPFRSPDRHDCCGCKGGSGCGEAASCASSQARPIQLHHH